LIISYVALKFDVSQTRLTADDNGNLCSFMCANFGYRYFHILHYSLMLVKQDLQLMTTVFFLLIYNIAMTRVHSCDKLRTEYLKFK